MSDDFYLIASRLTNRVMFQRLEKVRLSTGVWGEPKWVDAFKAWAEVLTIGGEEGRVAAAQSSLVRYRITLRYRKDVKPEMGIVTPSGQFVNIRSIRDPDGRNIYMEINGESKQGAV